MADGLATWMSAAPTDGAAKSYGAAADALKKYGNAEDVLNFSGLSLSFTKSGFPAE